MKRAIDAMQLRLDVGWKAMEEGRPIEEVKDRIIASISPEIEKLKPRGEGLYEYMTEELVPMWSRGFRYYYQRQQQEQPE